MFGRESQCVAKGLEIKYVSLTNDTLLVSSAFSEADFVYLLDTMMVFLT